MKKFSLFIFICLCINLFSQKNIIQDLKIVDYELISNNKIEIKSYATLDKKGNLTVYSDSWDGKNYFQYTLTSEEINQLNSLSGKNIESFVKQKQLNKNEYFAGNPRFMSYKSNGKVYSLCFIEPFMNNEFMDILKILNSKIYKHDETAKIQMQTNDFKKVEIEIIERSKVDNYLPTKAVIIQN
jgi:K+/H+ antiporter YhaU regulatory subunit KhtT